MNQPLSICMVSNLFPPIASGSSSNCWGLSRALAKQGHEVCVITTKSVKDAPEYEEVDRVHVYRLPCWRMPRLAISLNFPYLPVTLFQGNYKRMLRILDKHKPDILHQHNHMFDTALASTKLACNLHIPLVLTIHTLIKHSNYFYNAILQPIDRIYLKRRVIRHCAKLLCPSSVGQEYVAQAFGRAEEPIVPYGIDPFPETTQQEIETVRNRYGLQGKRVILSLGHLHELRNRVDLVRALPSIQREVPNTTLLIVGSISTKAPMQVAKELGIEDSVILTDTVPHEDLGPYIAVADLESHWLNSLSVEENSIGIAGMECMASGMAVVTVANEGMLGQGAIRNGDNIVLIRPGDIEQIAGNITNLLLNNEKRQSIGAQAAILMEQFSWQNIAEKTETLYREIID